MSRRPGHLTTIVVEKETLRELKHMARKDETYNELIKHMMKLRKQLNADTKDESVLGGQHSSNVEQQYTTGNSGRGTNG